MLQKTFIGQSIESDFEHVELRFLFSIGECGVCVCECMSVGLWMHVWREKKDRMPHTHKTHKQGQKQNSGEGREKNLSVCLFD